ncbi:hypothetical protein A3J23_01740 [Candidatus Peregrinibacteria bacterium RIFCSPLOWO2_02_FULL_48_14]|nr:MAG: hypothetical protein A3J23_01740 [Candidatus Peregrinibacteria bacterium RIFCSPLOWO2_02_FULL_48_14]
MKKLIFSIFALFISASVFSISVVAEDDTLQINNLMFSDVGLEEENYYAIYFLYNTGVIEGYENEEGLRDYRPGQSINRAEFLKIILEGTGEADEGSYDSCFPDVSEGEWYTDYVCQAKEEGWIGGYPDGTFKPDQTINEVEALKILGEVMDWELEETEGDWYEPYLEVGEETNIVPEEDIASLMTRGDIAELIFRNEQVEDLPISEYSEDYIEYYLELNDIPYDGTFGPGGVFGPDGPYGEAGPFPEGFTIFADDYYQEHYCYYSDQEEFYEELREELSSYSEEELEELFAVEDGDIYRFGKMSCYDEAQETDLLAFTEELRAEYSVICWPTDVDGEILCYDGTDYFAGGDEYDDVETGDNTGIFFADVYQSGPVNADGSPLSVFLTLIDGDFEPATGHSLVAMVMTPHSYESFDMGETEAGVYELTFTSYKAATYGVYILDEDTGEIYSTEASFGAGDVESMEILNVSYPFENEDHSARFEVILEDAYGNVVTYLDESDLTFESTLGEVFATLDEERGVWDVSLYASEVGDAVVTVTGDSTFDDLSESVEFFFDSVMLGIPRGLAEDESVTVPLYINMGDEGSLGEYEVSIVYNSGTLQFEEATEGTDDFMNTPTVSLSDGMITVNGQTTTGETTDQYVHVADLYFTGAVIGDGTIYAEDASITTTDEAPIQNILLQQAAAQPAVVVKGTKEVCLDIFILEGADSGDGSAMTEADINAEIAKAETAFAVAAASCNCPYFLEFAINFRELSRADWQTVTAATGVDGVTDTEDDVIEQSESRALSAAYGSADCIPVFYIPQASIPDEATGNWVTSGWSRASDPRNITIDESRDGDQTTLVHELMHMLSKNVIKDYNPNASEDDNATAVSQGGKEPGNIMNYGEAGFEMTAAQCALIDWDAWPMR